MNPSTPPDMHTSDTSDNAAALVTPAQQPLTRSRRAAQAPCASRVIAAWAVHAFTMSGLIWASLAAVALFEGQIQLMWLWLGIALIVDGVDGTLARKTCVKEVIPWFDGSVLDNVVDYLTWTFLPALFMYLYLPFGSRAVGMIAMIVATVSSVFCYANEGEKSADSYFVGFPAAWNVVAVTMYVMETPAYVNVAITVALAVLTLAPLHFTHPMRVRKLRVWNIIASVVWIASVALLVALGTQPIWALVAFWASGAWFLLSGIARTWRAKTDEEALRA